MRSENGTDFEEGPLSEKELRQLRRIIRDDDRMHWFWATARIWAGWGTATIAALYAGQDFIGKFFKALIAGFK